MIRYIPHKKDIREGLLKRLSIKHRLPLFIFILLLIVILTFSGVSYIGVKNASVEIGTERLTTLAGKLSVLFSGSTEKLAGTSVKVAAQKDLRNFLLTGNPSARLATLDSFKNILKKDSLCKRLELLNGQKQILLTADNAKLPLTLNIDSLTRLNGKKREFESVGKLLYYKNAIYYPSVAVVTDQSKITGYLVYWRVMRTTQKSIDQFNQILGSGGKMYFGNDDGSFWTDLVKPAAKPPVDLSKLEKVAQYKRPNGDPLIGAMRKIPNSRWLVLVEFSTSSILKTANLYLRWLSFIGGFLIIIGSLCGWLMSLNITNPLKQLTEATSAIAEGHYTSLVTVKRHDELGRLAESFNIMAVRVHTAQQELEQKVFDRTKELETAIIDIRAQKENEKKKDEFISIASHELKTPLTTIKAFFQLAKKEIHPELKAYNFINSASKQLNRMERLIEDLLDVSKINAGKMQYNIESLNFSELLADAVNSVQEVSSRHELVLQKSANVIFNGDRHRIEQVLINLLNNAVKYSPEADKVLIRSELKGDYLAVSVKDFGIGIEPKHLNELFERFYRIDNEHKFQGLGLGLFISSEIIKRHGGHITVTSTPGYGSEFVVELPVKNSAELIVPATDIQPEADSFKKEFN